MSSGLKDILYKHALSGIAYYVFRPFFVKVTLRQLLNMFACLKDFC